VSLKEEGKMTDWEDPEEQRVLAHVLRALQDWSQKQATHAAGLSKNGLSFSPLGRAAPTRKTLERLSDSVGLSFSHLGPLRALLARLRAGLLPAALPEAATADPTAMVAAAVTREVELEAALLLALVHGPDEPVAPPSERDLALGDVLWARLQGYPRGRWRVLVRGARVYRSWALCVRLCAESERTAAADPAEALFLADLALSLAGRVHGGEVWRSRLLGFCLAHRANALRLAKDLDEAARAVTQAWSLWRAGAAAASSLLSESRLLDLEASLRRDQGRFELSRALLDEALAKCTKDETERILLNQAVTLEQWKTTSAPGPTSRDDAPL
jgi:transcriptional regulator with XRE-family HTH domain